MEQKIAELRRKVTEVQQLSHTEDSVHFLQNCSSLSGLSESTDLPTDVRPPRCFEDVSVAVSEVRDKVEGILKEEGSKISLTVTEDVLLSRPEPKTRDEFLQYSRQITLDPNTAHGRMLLSEGNRKATGVVTDQLYPLHPDRFTGSWQVLSREDLTGRCYFEVEQRGRVSIAVSHKNIYRGIGGESGFGCNDKSWSLYCNNNRYQFIHKQISTPAPGPQSSRVGVYPDHRAGVLSFYSVSGTTMTLLHRVHTSFTQTLCAGFGFYGFDKVKQQIRSRQEAEVHQAEELQKKMEQKIAELRRKVTEVQQLSHTEDSFHFLQNSSSLSGLSESTDLPTDVRPPRCFEDVSVAVSEVRDKVEGILKEEGSKISLTVTEDVLLSRPEPKTRDEFLQYSRQITLDPNTAHRRMLLSEGNRKATGVGTDQLYPHHPDRFTGSWQVLSREDLTGRCYFEVEQRGRVSIAVSHKNIYRGIGGESGFGYNDKSWSLYCNNNRYQFIHKQISTPAPGPQSSRVGVYPDHRAGVLSFYSVSGTTMTLLHRVHTSFTQTLCAGFGFYWFDKEVRDKVEGILKEEGSKISLTVTEDVLLSRPEPKTRDEFLHYSRQITLDPNTAHRRMLLSEGNRKATGVVTDQLYPDHPDRFTGSWQVLSREDLTGRCYFEVEQRGRVSIAVSHKNIYRGIGGESGFGCNDKSWSLYCNNNRYQFIHKQISTPAPGPQSSRVGVYPDHRAGVLSFYSVSGTMMTLLHRVHTSFTQTLCAGFGFYWFDKALKSCLVCLASYCDLHLQPHYQSPTFGKHKLVNPCKTLQENICSRHNEVMKVFCRTDQQCICYLCSMEEHKDHDTVSAAAERNQRQKELGVSLQNIQQMIQDREKDLKVLQQRVEAINCSADKPKTRDEFLQYSRQITLDPNTAHGRMLLSEGNRKATRVVTDQLYPDHPDRFTGSWQVLSREDLTGRCYFEVEQRGRVSIAVSHKNISRGIGGESSFGYNDKSWSLYCNNNNRYQFIHKHISTPAPGPQSSRVGVYPDHRAGVLSFYSASGTTMTLLHRVHTSFTQTLCAGLVLGRESPDHNIQKNSWFEVLYCVYFNIARQKYRSSGMSVDAVDGAVLTL
ncbi:uncharacterized protein ACN63O_022176 [Diretmus argenteus]